jgi:branched-chain amino acid aminotransferase
VVSQAKLLWVNDGLVPIGEATLDPRDRGFTLGDGLFETIRVRGGRPLLVEVHLARLQAGAGQIGLARVPDNEMLSGAIRVTLEANGLFDAAVRLTVSRGVPAHRGLLSKPESAPSLVVHAQPFAGYPAELYSRGMRAAISRIPRNERSPLARVKALSYLDNVLARREADTRGVDEALMLNTAGHLACASAANLFLARGETLLTPDPASGVLPGTVRGLVMAELAPQMGLTVVERPVRTEELAKADEAFLTSALLGVMPLTEVDGLSVGTGEPGPISSDLRAKLKEVL